MSDFVPKSEIIINDFMVDQSHHNRSIVEKFIIAMADAGYTRYRGYVHLCGKTLEFVPNFLFLGVSEVNLFECFKGYCASVNHTDRYNEWNGKTLVTQIRKILGDGFKKCSISKGHVGYTGRGILETRKILNEKLKIKTWENDLSYCAGCYKNHLLGVLLFDDMKTNENLFLPFTTFNKDKTSDERIQQGLIELSWYGKWVADKTFMLVNKKGKMADSVTDPIATYNSDSEDNEPNDGHQDGTHELILSHQDVGKANDLQFVDEEDDNIDVDGNPKLLKKTT